MVRLHDGELVARSRQLPRHLLGQLQHHLHADREVGAVQQARLRRSARPRMSASLSYQPVVPITIFAPVARHARMFCTTASGVVKSITTSKPATNGGSMRARVRVLLRIQHMHAVPALRRHLGHQLARLPLPQHQNPHDPV